MANLLLLCRDASLVSLTPSSDQIGPNPSLSSSDSPWSHFGERFGAEPESDVAIVWSMCSGHI